jgi:hypothetical protein
MPPDLEEFLRRSQDKLRTVLPGGGLGGKWIGLVAIAIWGFGGRYPRNSPIARPTIRSARPIAIRFVVAADKQMKPYVLRPLRLESPIGDQETPRL